MGFQISDTRWVNFAQNRPWNKVDCPLTWLWHQNFLPQENSFFIFILVVMQEVYLIIVLLLLLRIGVSSNRFQWTSCCHVKWGLTRMYCPIHVLRQLEVQMYELNYFMVELSRETKYVRYFWPKKNFWDQEFTNL